MKKRYFTILMGIILFLSFAIMIYQAVSSNKNKSKNLDEAKSKIYENVQNREEETVSDECINEWEDYAQYLNEDVKETGSDIGEDDTRYVLKNDYFSSVKTVTIDLYVGPMCLLIRLIIRVIEWVTI